MVERVLGRLDASRKTRNGGCEALWEMCPDETSPFGGTLNVFGRLFRGSSRLPVLVVVVFCAATAAALLLVVFWGWLSGGESGSTTIRNIGLVLAGIIALPLAIWRGLVAEQSLLNERYQKGAEMLGSEVLSVRLGGIYALRRLAEEHPEQYHIQIMRLFCSFVRLPTRDQSLTSGQAGIEAGAPTPVRQDVEAVIEAIASRSKQRVDRERQVDFRLDLRGANLRGLQVLKADMSRAYFQTSNLAGAYFVDTDLSDAFFTEADLSGAVFMNVNFVTTRFWNAKLSGATLQGDDMHKASLQLADLSNANLLRADLSDAFLGHAVLTNAYLEGANLNRASFLGADLSGACLVMADLSQADFLDADLSDADLSDADLTGVEFSSGPQTARGMRQAQLDEAKADPGNLPSLAGVCDAESGEPLIWRGKQLSCPRIRRERPD